MQYLRYALIGVLTLIVLVIGWSYVAAMLTSDNTVETGVGVLIVLGVLGTLAYTGIRLGSRVVVIAALALTVTGCTRVEPGWEGIKVDMVGNNRGERYPIVTGRVWYNPYTEDVYQFPTFQQRVVWTMSKDEGSGNDESFTFRSKEGYAFNVDVGMAMSFRQGKTPDTFVKYRADAATIISGPMRDIVREAFVKAGGRMEGLHILGSGMPALNEAVTQIVKDQINAYATVDYVNVIGKPRVDERVEHSINAVIAASQEANEAVERIRKKEAEAKQAIAEAQGKSEALIINAKGKAEAIRIEADALRTYGQQVLDMRAIEKWDGTLPQVTGGSGVPFLNLKGVR